MYFTDTLSIFLDKVSLECCLEDPDNIVYEEFWAKCKERVEKNK